MRILLTRSLAIAFAALVCGATFDVSAQEAANAEHVQKSGEKLRDKFNVADIDHDGSLTRDEAAKAMPRVAKHFDDIDTNHDGKLSMQEITQFIIAKRKARE